MYPMMGYGGMQGGMQQGMMPDTRDGFQEYGTFAEPNGILDPLTAVVFDPCEELIWTGTQTVRSKEAASMASTRDLDTYQSCRSRFKL